MTVRFFVNAVVQDRPEHSEFVCSIGHNGIFGALPGYSFPRHLTRDSGKRYSLKKDLVSCHICHRTRKRLVSLGRYHDASAPSRTCSRCHDWEILNVTFSSNGHLPTSLPQSCYVNCNVRKQLRSRKVSFETMLAALKHIFRLVYMNIWSDFSKTVRLYAS